MRQEREKRTRAERALPPQEDYYADYYPPEEEAPDDREQYYAQRDAYYAQRDAYYARRDAWYARQEAEAEERERTEARPVKAHRRVRERTTRDDYVPEDADGPALPVRRGRRHRRRRRGGVFRRLALLLVIIIAALLLLGSPPVVNPEGLPRVEGRSTVLLTAAEPETHEVRLLTLLCLERGTPVRALVIPADIPVADYTSDRLGGVYAAVGGGPEGMERLQASLRELLGFAPDGYVLLSTDAVEKTADILGGVDATVEPAVVVDGALIVPAGEQHLSGEQFAELLRLQAAGTGAAPEDLWRDALLSWLKAEHLRELPTLWRLWKSSVTTDLSYKNLLWIARVLMKADTSRTETHLLPGGVTEHAGEVYYGVDRVAARLLLRSFDPYQRG